MRAQVVEFEVHAQQEKQKYKAHLGEHHEDQGD